MKLGRIAELAIGSEDPLPPCTFDIAGVTIVMQPIPEEQEKKPRRALLIAETALSSLPDSDLEGHVTIPDAERKHCEERLEQASDLLSVVHRSRHELASPIPCVALIPETDEENEWLDGTAGIVRNPAHSIAGNAYPPGLDTDHIAQLSDRMGGVQLLSEVHSQMNVLGKYRALVRFFEAAFACSLVELEKKLAQFLGAGHLGYGRDEVKRWVGYRHGAAHGDKKKTTALVFEPDVWPFVGKMVDAAYDTLLNKAEWGDRSRNRRDIWQPQAYLQEDGTLSITECMDVRILSRVLDEFGGFPLSGKQLLKLPDGWWYRAAEEAPSASGSGEGAAAVPTD